MKKKINHLNITRFFTALTLTSTMLLAFAEVESEKRTLQARAGEIIESDNYIEEEEEIGYTVCDLDQEAYQEYEKMKAELEEEKKEAEANKEYSGMALSHEYEDYIRRTAAEYNIPAELMLCLGNVETGETWGCNGVYSNGNYGQFQINICNLKQIHEHFKWGSTIEETGEMLKNDDEKNAEAAIWLVSLILKYHSYPTFQGICQSYNGGPNKVNYAYICANYMDKYFPDKLAEVEEQLRNYTPKEPDRKHNRQLENDILADRIDKKNVKKLV